MVKYIWLTKRKIRELIDVPRVERAIAAAERLTSGEIRVSISPWFWGSPERAADEAFSRLGMTETREHNGTSRRNTEKPELHLVAVPLRRC